jgi:predicted glycoside hydrolase/deacetylase ChbG (UPF0249 family)
LRETSGCAKLIINGDDFGLSVGVNHGIIHLYREGRLTSTSLMVNEAASDQAIEFALRNPGLGVGLHLNLTTGCPTLPAGEVRTLVDGDGSFLPPSRLAMGVMTGRVKQGEIRDELAAQIELCNGVGLRLSHLDSHYHIHAIPIIGRIVGDLAGRYGIGRIRTPRVTAVLVPHIVARIGVLASKSACQGPEGGNGQGPSTWEPMELRRESFRTTRYLLYLRWWLGDRALDDLHRTLKALRGCPIEISSHPGFMDEGLVTSDDYVEGRLEELRLLDSPGFRDMLDDLGFALANFTDL